VRHNDGTVTAPIEPPDGLVLPEAMFPPFWAAYPTLGQGSVNGLTALRGDVRARVGAEGPEGVCLHMVAGGARTALRELASMTATAEKGRGLVHDRRSRLGEVLDALLRNPVLMARGVADSLHITHQTATSALSVLGFSSPVLRVRASGRDCFRAFALKI
jgi:hypothetical protein